jgi:hypothetical protein
MVSVVLAVAIGFFIRPTATAAALVLSWVIGEAVYLITGNNIPLNFYLFCDISVIGVIYAKPRYRPCPSFDGALHQLRCLILERCPTDRVVLAIFPLMWVAYAAEISAYAKWWSLWWLVLAQFAAAAWEVISLERRDADAANCPPDHSGPLLAVPSGGGFG